MTVITLPRVYSAAKRIYVFNHIFSVISREMNFIIVTYIRYIRCYQKIVISTVDYFARLAIDEKE